MDKIKELKEIIKLKELIMMESQAQIRQSEKMLETMQKIYKRAFEDRSDLQAKLIKELEKNNSSKQ